MMRCELIKNLRIRWVVGAVLILFIWFAMLFPGLAEWYVRMIYGPCSSVVARVSGVFPFSVGDCIIYGSLVGLLAYAVYAFVRHRPFKRILGHIVEYLGWIYIWFYLAWGMSYFRVDFFARTQIPPVAYTSDSFHEFLSAYTDSLNAAWIPVEKIDTLLTEQAVKQGYRSIATRFGMKQPDAYLRPKPMLAARLMSSVGVLGYMGPFVNEFNLNPELLPVQYPFTYAHEMAHILGIASEAEANLYAYLVCTHSDSEAIRFSGYFGLLPYIVSNAYGVLSEADFKQWTDTIRPEVKELYAQKAAYWQAKYSPFIGKAQHVLYDWFLKGNSIPSGQENYAEVVGLLIAYDQATEK